MAITKNRQFEEIVPSSIAGSDARTSFLTWFFAPSVVQVPSSALG